MNMSVAFKVKFTNIYVMFYLLAFGQEFANFDVTCSA